MEYTLRCISVQLQADSYAPEQAVAESFTRAAGQSLKMAQARLLAKE